MLPDRDPVVDRLVVWLEGYAQHARSSFEANDVGYARGSLADQQINSAEAAHFSPAWEPRLADDSFVAVAPIIYAGTDHLMALSRVIALPPMIFAGYTIGRAALELSARAYCLLDPELSVRARVARHVSENVLYSLWEAEQLGLEMNAGGTPAKNTERSSRGHNNMASRSSGRGALAHA
jgi:hypothetical protein